MPELPEVETIRRQLAQRVRGKTIAAVRVLAPKVVREPSPALFAKGLTGAAIVQVLRKGKLLILELSNKKALCIHLKMTGQLIYPGDGINTRVTFTFKDGTTLDFKDRRLFAELRLVDDWTKLPFVQGLGPEPRDLTPAQFTQMLAAKKTKIKPLLLDQTFLSGVGNLYAAEALFKARIHPARPAASLAPDERQRLHAAIVKVLDDATAHGGSSVDQYVQLDGSPGAYNRFHTVYGKDGKPCSVCRTPITRVALGGRGTYFCARCQQ